MDTKMKGSFLKWVDERRPRLFAAAIGLALAMAQATASGQTDETPAPAREEAAATADGAEKNAEGAPTPAVERAAPSAADAPPEVAAAVRELDSDRYATRQAAQRRLNAIGLPALDATADAAANGSLESSTRAVSILWKWAESNESPLNRLALEEIASLKNRPVESADAQQRLAVLREEEAIRQVAKLGGRVEADRTFGFIGGAGQPLQVIVGKDWEGGVEGLKHIADIPRATTLSLWSAPLGDEALPRLEELGAVRRLELYGLKMTPELVEKTRGKLPNTIVEVRGPARLGIRGIDAIEIVPNSPAAKAGLVVHDRIIEFNGKPIDTGKPTEDFNALTTEIGKCEAGQTVKIKFRRGQEIREAEVTFDAWGTDVSPGAPLADVPPQQQGLFGPVPRIIPQQAQPRIQIEQRFVPLPQPAAKPKDDPALPE
jgi:hypothetical protein